MSNRLVDLRLTSRSLDPLSAELLVTATVERLTPGTELRGRFHGPRCSRARTIEVAHPLLPPRPADQQANGLQRRVAIAEPCLWDPETPYLYVGTMELWQDGHLCQQIQVEHGFRQVTFTSRRLCVNGKAMRASARTCEMIDENVVPRWRQEGICALVVSVRPDTLACWSWADRQGFLVFGLLANPDEDTASQLLSSRAQHASAAGWLLGPDWYRADQAAARRSLESALPGGLIGRQISPGEDVTTTDPGQFLATVRDARAARDYSPWPVLELIEGSFVPKEGEKLSTDLT